jgi:signal transduction histidine kinase
VAREGEVHPMLAAIWPELASRYGVRSLAWVPILTATAATHEFYSLRLLQVTHPRHWTEAELNLLRGIAAQLAMALNNAQLFRAQLQTARELQDKNAELQSLVYSVSHDLQAPIVSVHGFANLLQARHGGQLDERGQAYVGRIVANAEYLTQLLTDLLELSRVGRVEEPLEKVEVGPLVEGVVANWTSRSAYAEVQVTLPADWPVVIYSPTRLRQVFSNLVSNAFKFMGPQPAPGVALGWQVLDSPEARLIEFSVQDNGIGIRPDYHQRIFGTFERLKQVDVEGTGIGLSIVKRIVESRGGTVRVESAPGAGATFYFTVPVVAEPGAGQERET